MEDYIREYFSLAADTLLRVARDSGPSIHQAAAAVADAIASNRDFLLFGSGHSALIAHEAAGRAGGLIPAIAVEDIADGDAERLEGMAALILGRYELRPQSVIVVISHSGINAVPVEAAMLAKNAGMKVIAITSLEHSKGVAARHSSGKKLYEVADIVIDTHGVPGDAAIEMPTPHNHIKSGATSTVIGASIIQAITVQAAALLAERDPEIAPPVFVSSNVPGGDSHNKRVTGRYRSRMVRYTLPAMLGPAIKDK